MVLLLLYWSFLGMVFLNLGWGFQKLLRIKKQEPILIFVFGMFTATILASIWAIAYRLNIEFQFFLMVLQGWIVLCHRKELFAVYRNLGLQFRHLSTALKTLLGLALLLTLLCILSNRGFVDNETYYVQTIKWLNEYGFVKGLANLHIFFGQTCGWHILQSAFSFSFLSNHFNQLNGFCLLLGNVFAVFRLDTYFKNGQRNLLWIALLPVVNIVLFAYCAVPSPGLALAIISLILFDYFLSHFDQYASDSLLILWLLAIFLVYIKISILPIVWVPVAYTIKHFRIAFSNIASSLVAGFLVLALFVTKNCILTGFPLYPSRLFKNQFQADYALPESLYSFWFHRAKGYDFFISSHEYQQADVVKIFLKWLFFSSDSLMHSLIILLVLILPYFIQRYFNQSAYWWLYAVLVSQLLYMGFTSPQFRFMIPMVLFFGLLLLSIKISQPKTIYAVQSGTMLLAFLVWWIAPKIGTHQCNLVYESPSLSWQSWVIPNQNSNLKTHYGIQKLGNLQYFSPDASAYIWANGDGPLPCVNQKQLYYLDLQLQYIPQLRSTHVKDGFYSLKTNKP